MTEALALPKPNALWCTDVYHKLEPRSIAIGGCTDGFSLYNFDASHGILPLLCQLYCQIRSLEKKLIDY